MLLLRVRPNLDQQQASHELKLGMLWVSHVLALVGPLDQASDLQLGQRASWGGYPLYHLFQHVSTIFVLSL